MKSLLLFLVAVSLLLPPSACCCWSGSPFACAAAATPDAPAAELAAKPAGKCACCEESVPLASPAESGTAREVGAAPSAPAEKEHAPSCPVVRKLDRVRVVSAATAIEIAELLSFAASIDLVPVFRAPTDGFAVTSHWPDGPPRHLRFSVLLI